MKHAILLITLFFAGQAFAQSESKSEQIAKEIQSLELESNKLILNEYIKEQSDTTLNISIQNIGRKLLADFQNSHPDLKELKDEFDSNIKAIDKIKYSYSDYRKYRENFVGSTGEERKKQEAIYRGIYNKLYKSDKKFKELNDINRKVLAKLNYLTLTQMIAEHHQRNEVFNTAFIPYTDLNRYQQLSKIKENRKKIDVLNGLYRRVLEKELDQKYNTNDSSKAQNSSAERSVKH